MAIQGIGASSGLTGIGSTSGVGSGSGAGATDPTGSAFSGGGSLGADALGGTQGGQNTPQMQQIMKLLEEIMKMLQQLLQGQGSSGSGSGSGSGSAAPAAQPSGGGSGGGGGGAGKSTGISDNLANAVHDLQNGDVKGAAQEVHQAAKASGGGHSSGGTSLRSVFRLPVDTTTGVVDSHGELTAPAPFVEVCASRQVARIVLGRLRSRRRFRSPGMRLPSEAVRCRTAGTHSSRRDVRPGREGAWTKSARSIRKRISRRLQNVCDVPAYRRVDQARASVCRYRSARKSVDPDRRARAITDRRAFRAVFGIGTVADVLADIAEGRR